MKQQDLRLIPQCVLLSSCLNCFKIGYMQGEDVDRREDVLWNFFGRQCSKNFDMARPACSHKSAISLNWRDQAEISWPRVFGLSDIP